MTDQSNRGDQDRARDERMGRGVKEGLDAGTSRNAHTSGADRGTAGYGASGGPVPDHAETAEELYDRMETGSTEARTRPENVGRQAESGIETDPEEGNRH